jgi:hypothetical protein
MKNHDGSSRHYKSPFKTDLAVLSHRRNDSQPFPTDPPVPRTSFHAPLARLMGTGL